LAIVSTTLTEGAKCNKPIGNLVAAGGAGPAVGVPGEHDAHHWRSEIWAAHQPHPRRNHTNARAAARFRR